MNSWIDRPMEVAALLNPAFAGVLLHESVRNFEKVRSSSMPVALLFLAAPIALHSPTRRALPKSTIAKMKPWIDETPEARIGFPERVRALRTFVREGILMASNSGLVAVAPDGGLVALRRSSVRLPESWSPGSDSHACWWASGFIARWFAATAGTPTLFALWGVKP